MGRIKSETLICYFIPKLKGKKKSQIEEGLA